MGFCRKNERIEERLGCRWAWFDLGVSVGYYGWRGGFVSEGGEIFGGERRDHAYIEERFLTSRTAFGMTGIFCRGMALQRRTLELPFADSGWGRREETSRSLAALGMTVYFCVFCFCEVIDWIRG